MICFRALSRSAHCLARVLRGFNNYSIGPRPEIYYKYVAITVRLIDFPIPYTLLHTHLHLHLHTYIHLYTRPHTCTHTHTHPHPRTRTNAHAHAQARPRTPTRMCTRTRTHARMHTQTHACVHTHMSLMPIASSYRYCVCWVVSSVWFSGEVRKQVLETFRDMMRAIVFPPLARSLEQEQQKIKSEHFGSSRNTCLNCCPESRCGGQFPARPHAAAVANFIIDLVCDICDGSGGMHGIVR
jgi:hypothetical protein